MFSEMVQIGPICTGLAHSIIYAPNKCGIAIDNKRSGEQYKLMEGVAAVIGWHGFCYHQNL